MAFDELDELGYDRYKKVVRINLGKYKVKLIVYDEHDVYTELDQYPSNYRYIVEGEFGEITSGELKDVYFSDVGSHLEDELSLNHSSAWPRIAAYVSEKLTEAIQERQNPIAFVTKKVSFRKEHNRSPYKKSISSQSIWEKREAELKAEQQRREEEAYNAFVAESRKKLETTAPFIETYGGENFFRHKRAGVIIAKKENGQNIYVLKTPTKETPLMGMTRQLQHALGIRYDLPKSIWNRYGYTEDTKDTGDNRSAMERGSRIHSLVEKAIKRGTFTVNIGDSEKINTLIDSLHGRHETKKQIEKRLDAALPDFNNYMLEAYQAQAALIKVKKEFPAGAGWEIKSEYTVSDYKYYASSVDILAINKRTKEAVVLDLKTGSKTPLNYVTAQTSSYATLLKRNDALLKDYDIRIGKIDFSEDRQLKTPKITMLHKLSDKMVDKLLYTREQTQVGFFYRQGGKDSTPAFIPRGIPEVLPFARENINDVFSLKTRKISDEGKVAVFDLETVPLKNGVSAVRAVSILNLTQNRDDRGRVSLYHSGRQDELFERTYLSRETFNSTTRLTLDQSQALEENMLTDEVVERFEKLSGRGKAHIATSNDILEVMKNLSGKTVVGHNIIDYDFPVLFYTGSYEAKLEGGEKARSEFIERFNEYMKTMTIIDTLDLARILQKGRENVLEDITNGGLVKLFSPAVYEHLKSMLHQSSADVLVTAKNFETIMNIMTPTEREVLFQLIKDRGYLKNKYTVTASTPRVEGESDKFSDVRFSLVHSGTHILNRVPVITANQWAYIKAKIKHLTELEKQQMAELIKEEAAYDSKHEVYYRRKGNTLYLTSPYEDELNKNGNKSFIKQMATTIGALLKAKKNTDVSFDYRQNYDSIILSELGDILMVDGLTGFDINKEELAVAKMTLDTLGNPLREYAKTHYADQNKLELIKEILGGLSEKEARYFFKHINELRQLYSSETATGNMVPDSKTDKIVTEALMSKLNMSGDSIRTKISSNLKLFSTQTINKVMRDTLWERELDNLSPEAKINLFDKLEEAGFVYKELNELAKRNGREDDFIKAIQNSSLGDFILSGKYTSSDVRKKLNSVYEVMNRSPQSLGPAYKSNAERVSAIVGGVAGLPNISSGVLSSFAKTVKDYSFTDEGTNFFTSSLKDSVGDLFKYGSKIGLKGTYADEFQEQLLHDISNGNGIDFINSLSFAEKLLDDQEAAEKASKQGSDKRSALEQTVAALAKETDAEANQRGEIQLRERLKKRERIAALARETDAEANQRGEIQLRERLKERAAEERKATYRQNAENERQKEYFGRLNEINSLRRRNPFMSESTYIGLLDAASSSAEHFADAIQEVTDSMGKATRVFGGVSHSMAGIPFYNPERFFGTAYSQIGGIHSSLKGLLPNFMNTSITKMLTGTTQDYEQEWLSTKYGLKKADAVMPIIGAVLGAVTGGPNPMSIAVGASLGKGAAAIASQFIGLGREENVEAAGLFFQSRFNKMGAMLTAVTGALGLFTKALKLATVPILGGVGFGVYHYKRALANMSNFETPLTNLTGISYGNYYQDFERSDLAYGMARGTTNKIIEGIEFQKQGLFTLGRYDKDKLISAAMLGVLDNAFIPNGRNGASNYATMMSKLYTRMSGASEAEQQRMMYLLNLYNPDMARQIQVRTDLTNFLSKQDAGSIYKRRANYFDITNDQRQEFRAVSFFQGNFADSINKSIMKVALGLYKWKGFGFMNELTGVIGRAGDYFAAGKYNEGLGEIADGIIRLMKGIGDTWKEVKDKLGVSSISDDIINRAKLIGYKLELVLLDIGDYALGIIDKVQGPLGNLGTLLMKQFSKLFEFVGTLRFDYDLKKLAKGQVGGITAHWGYTISDYDAKGGFSREELFGLGPNHDYTSVEDYVWKNQFVADDLKIPFNQLPPEEQEAWIKEYNSYKNGGKRFPLREAAAKKYIKEAVLLGTFNEEEAKIMNNLVGNYSPEAGVDQWHIARVLKSMDDNHYKGSFKDFVTTPGFLFNGDKTALEAVQRIFGYTSREVQNIIDVSSYTGLIGKGLDIVRTGLAEEKTKVQGKVDKLVISLDDGVKERNVGTVTGEQLQLQEATEYTYALTNQF